jgi:F-type H+-transporting ATPase subunit epsilon
MKLEIVTPEKIVYSREVGMVVLPGAEGDMGVLQNHSPLVSDLREGEIAIFENATDAQPKERFQVKGGIAQVTANECTILATEIATAA